MYQFDFVHQNIKLNRSRELRINCIRWHTKISNEIFNLSLSFSNLLIASNKKKKSVDKISIINFSFQKKKKRREYPIRYFLLQIVYKKKEHSLWFISGTQRNRSVSSPATHRYTYTHTYADFARETNSRARD